MRDADASADADESESDDDRGLRKQALAVDGEPDYSTGPPMDGFEYLRRVAFEAKQTPDIMRATNLDLSAFEAGEAAVSSTREDEEIEYAPPSWATADREWVRRTVGDFSELRVRVSRAIAGRIRPTATSARGNARARTKPNPHSAPCSSWTPWCAHICSGTRLEGCYCTISTAMWTSMISSDVFDGFTR